MFFAQGDMVGKNPLTPEWVQMANAIKGGGRSLENYSIPLALANREPTSPATKRKEDANGEGSDTPMGKLKKKLRKENEHETEPKDKKKKREMDINPIIKSKITLVLPEFWQIKKLCTICDTEQKNLFGLNICAFAALSGHCPFFKCRSSHDGSLVTDEIAESVVQKLQPFLRNPSQLTEG
jgi:hypothetical protein